MKKRLYLAWTAVWFCGMTAIVSAQEFQLDAGKYAVFQTSGGGFVMKLFPDKAPQTVENFVALATGKKSWRHPVTLAESTRPIYDNTQFYFVVPDRELRGGDPVSRGTGGPGFNLSIENSAVVPRTAPGMVSMDQTVEVSNGSRFNINLDARPGEKAAVFGQVVSGLDNISEFSRKPASGGKPLDPVTIQSVSIIDVPAASVATGRFVNDNNVKAVEIDREMKALATPTPVPTPTPTPKPTKKVDSKKADAKAETKAKDKSSDGEKRKETDKSKSKDKSKAIPKPQAEQTPQVQQEQPKESGGNKLLFWRKKQ